MERPRKLVSVWFRGQRDTIAAILKLVNEDAWFEVEDCCNDYYLVRLEEHERHLLDAHPHVPEPHTRR